MKTKDGTEIKYPVLYEMMILYIYVFAVWINQLHDKTHALIERTHTQRRLFIEHTWSKEIKKIQSICICVKNEFQWKKNSTFFSFVSKMLKPNPVLSMILIFFMVSNWKNIVSIYLSIQTEWILIGLALSRNPYDQPFKSFHNIMNGWVDGQTCQSLELICSSFFTIETF